MGTSAEWNERVPLFWELQSRGGVGIISFHIAEVKTEIMGMSATLPLMTLPGFQQRNGGFKMVGVLLWRTMPLLRIHNFLLP